MELGRSRRWVKGRGEGITSRRIVAKQTLTSHFLYISDVCGETEMKIDDSSVPHSKTLRPFIFSRRFQPPTSASFSGFRNLIEVSFHLMMTGSVTFLPPKEGFLSRNHHHADVTFVYFMPLPDSLYIEHLFLSFSLLELKPKPFYLFSPPGG